MRPLWLASCVVAVLLMLLPSGTALARHAKCSKPAEECAAALRETYQVKGWSGMEMEELDDATIRVLAVIPNGPADRVGIEAGDLLVSMNGVTLSPENAVKLRAMKDGGLKIGEKVAYGVKRGKEITTRDVTLEKIPEAVLTSLIDRHSKEEHEVARNR